MMRCILIYLLMIFLVAAHRPLKDLTDEEFRASRDSQAKFFQRILQLKPFQRSEKSFQLDSLCEDEHGRYAKLSYDVELSEFHDFIALDQSDHNIIKIRSEEQGTNLHFDFKNLYFAEKFKDLISTILSTGLRVMLTGGNQWGIKWSYAGPQSQAHPILAEVIDNKSVLNITISGVNNYSLSVNIVHVDLATAFKYADINVEIRSLPEDYYYIRNKRTDKSYSHEHELHAGKEILLDESSTFSSIRSWIKYTWQEVKDFAQEVYQQVKNITTTALDVSNGNLQGTTSPVGIVAVNYNYDASTHSAMQSFDILKEMGYSNPNIKVTCEQCYAYADVSFVMQISIQDYNLNTVSAYVLGNAMYSLQVVGTISKVSYSYKNTIYTYTSPAYPLSIAGIPITLQLSTPVVLKLDAIVEDTVTISSTNFGSIFVKAGMTLNEKGVQQINENNINSLEGNPLQVTQACKGTASASVSITPMMKLIISFVGGPNIGLQNTIEVIYSYGNKTIVSNYNFLGTIGVNLDVKLVSGSQQSKSIYKKDFGPFAVVKATKNLFNVHNVSIPCIDFQSNSVASNFRLLQAIDVDDYANDDFVNSNVTYQWNVPGQVWYGKLMYPACCVDCPTNVTLTAQLAASNSSCQLAFFYVSQYNVRTFALSNFSNNGTIYAAEQRYCGATQAAYVVDYSQGFGNNTIFQPCNGDESLASACDIDIPGWEEITYQNSTFNSTYNNDAVVSGDAFFTFNGTFYGSYIEFIASDDCAFVILDIGPTSLPVLGPVTNDDDRGSLSTAELAGVIVGSVIGTIIACFCAYYVYLMCKGTNRTDSSNDINIPIRATSNPIIK